MGQLTRKLIKSYHLCTTCLSSPTPHTNLWKYMSIWSNSAPIKLSINNGQTQIRGCDVTKRVVCIPIPKKTSKRRHEAHCSFQPSSMSYAPAEFGGSCTSFWTCKYEIHSSKINAWSVESLDFNISNSAFGGYRKGISSAPAYFLMNDNSWFASMLSPCILWAWQYSSPSSMFFSRLQGFAPISLAQWIPDEGTMTVFLSHAKNTASNIGKFLHNSFTCFLYRKRASIDFYKNTV